MSNDLYETLGKDIRWIQNLLFAGIFIQENRLHTVYDRYNDLTSKQWLLMAVSKAFDTPPDLSTLGEAMGCSRQNVKKLALQLEQKGYITFVKSSTDARALCVKKTAEGEKFSQEMSKLGAQVHEAMFREFSEEEIRQYYAMSIKMMHGIDYLEEFFQSRPLN